MTTECVRWDVGLGKQCNSCDAFHREALMFGRLTTMTKFLSGIHVAFKRIVIKSLHIRGGGHLE